MAILDAVAPMAPPAIASFGHADWSLEALEAAKGDARVVVCIPARDEARTIGAIVGSIRCHLQGRIVDEILVVDDGSLDATAVEAERHGAVVVQGAGPGKGEAMRLARGRGDYVVFLDGDVENFAPHFVSGLLGPLLCREGTVLVKGSYARPLGDRPNEGGRVTELVAKPLLSLLFPELGGIAQPLAGETAIRHDVLDALELTAGYGVEMGLLLDVWRAFGTAAIAQVDLGVRRHRNRPLSELAPQARDVIAAALERSSPPSGDPRRLLEGDTSAVHLPAGS